MLKSATLDVETIVDIGRPRSAALAADAYAVLKRHERALWAAAVAALVGDLLLTVYGLGSGLTESNPVVRGALATGGVTAFAGVKLLVLAAGWLGSRISPEHGPAIALGLLLPWGLASVNNAIALTVV